MPNKHENLKLLLRRVLESYTDFPRELRVEFTVLRGDPLRVDWRVFPNINDVGKLIGRKATHIKALQVLLWEIGSKRGEHFVLRRIEDGVGVREGDMFRRPARPTFNPVAHALLMRELLCEVCEDDVNIDVARDQMAEGVEFVFKVQVATMRDYEVLSVPTEDETMTVIAAVGTLWRAMGHKEGVSFKVELPNL